MIETVAGLTDLQIKLFTAVGQILVAAAVGAIAWRQWRTAQQQADTARKKLVLDLFDRRIELYERIEEVLAELEQGRHPNATFLKLHSLMRKCRWVFGPTIVDQLNTKVLPAFNELLKANAAFSPSMPEEEVRNSQLHLAEVLSDVGKAWIELPKIFAEALTLRD